MAAMTQMFSWTFWKIDAAQEIILASGMLNTKGIEKAVL